MLILTRKINEKLIIDGTIVVSVIEVRGDMVKLGIDAPRSVKVFRSEVYDAIQAENRQAAASGLQLPDIGLGSRE
ncbi:MAG: carbon storage regulator [Spirochaetes bacterium GWD1_61_31]|nr:MAG: carbon storage regulator [Spirochaetes bacterium GWB1_60_80]OHD29475.1 MAG: carbon storage regulator [Spirochaetes bacterium GWC1_61_12]OHD43995.1 MAG: carbon storage regulator [Spirochaetes bacterium GWD1_61_31]OHD46193.1 MAG: carbon storage regulator [Spirochaetes bacterium GWE1_60_18]OHD60731.1 MAG: carbon storage regulator [Spirochaetes bacterium GWF1_60_12]HAP43877.1 carbon storage regulator [Spirochaetaceae bacterium]